MGLVGKFTSRVNSFLPEERLNIKTKDLYNILQRRFKNGSNYYKYSDGHSGSVWSPIAKRN